MIVYRISNMVNGKSYIGTTTRSLEARWACHVKSARRGSKFPLHAAIRKYTPDSFTAQIVCHATSLEQMYVVERALIAQEGTFIGGGAGYNATLGGEGCHGYRHTPQALQKMSVIHKGKKISEPHRLRVSEYFSSVTRTDTWVEHISEALTGRPKSFEHRQSLSRALKGRKRPDLAGEKHGGAKLKDAQRFDIARRYAAGEMSQQKLANEYGVSLCAIQGALRFARRYAPQQG